MKKLFILPGLLFFLLFTACEKEGPLEQSITLVNLRDSLIGGFSLEDQFTNTDSVVCAKTDTMGKTILTLGDDCLGEFNWESGIYCAGISPTKIEAAVFAPYSIILVGNGNQQSISQRKNLLICKNNQFSFGITINAVNISNIVYTNGFLKLTCNNTSAHGEVQPDYFVLVKL